MIIILYNNMLCRRERGVNNNKFTSDDHNIVVRLKNHTTTGQVENQN